MTLGAAPEALVLGYLRNQRLVDSIDDIVSVQVDWEVNACSVTTRHGLKNLDEKMAKRTKTTGCGEGTVFGDLMEEVDKIQLRRDVFVEESTLFGLFNNVRLHRVDLQAGRCGARLRAGRGREHSDLCRGRGPPQRCGYHRRMDVARRGLGRRQDLLHHRAAYERNGDQGRADAHSCAGVALEGLTQMGYEIARKVGITMIGRAVNRHYLLFTGDERLVTKGMK